MRCFSSNRYRQGDDEELAESSRRAPNAGTVTPGILSALYLAGQDTSTSSASRPSVALVHSTPTICTDYSCEEDPVHAYANVVSPSSRDFTRPARQAVFKDKVSSRFLFRLPRIPCFSSARFVVCNTYDSEPCCKFGEKILGAIISILQNTVASPDVRTRQCPCLILSDIMYVCPSPLVVSSVLTH